MTDQTKHRKEIKKWLEVKYTDQEISEKSMELARKTGELRTAEENKKSVMSQLKSEIDSLSADTNKLGGEIVAGGEFRNVKCELEYNYTTNKKTIIRIDTMECIYDGPIPDDERQIPLSEPNKKEVPQVMVEMVVELSKENTAGTVLDEKAIEEVFSHCEPNVSLDRVDDLISQHESKEGYLVKARDFIGTLHNPPTAEQSPETEPNDTAPPQTDSDEPPTEEIEGEETGPSPLIAEGSIK